MRKLIVLVFLWLSATQLYCQNDREVFINNKKYWIDRRKTEQNGFEWSLIHEITNNKRYGDDKDNFSGVMVNGKIVLPCEFATIYYKVADEKDVGCFVVTKYYLGDCCKCGAYTISGDCIIPAKSLSNPDSEDFWKINRVRDKDIGVINEVYQHLTSFYINDEGKEVVCLDKQCKEKVFDNSGNLSFYVVESKQGTGVMDKNRNWIIKPKYNLIFSEKINNKTYFLVCSPGFIPNVLLDERGNIIIPYGDFKRLQVVAEKYILFEQDDYCGIMTIDKKVLIPLSRGYTSIKYNKTLNQFQFTKAGYRGECDGNGKQLSLIKVESHAAKTTSAKSSTSHSSGSTTTQKKSSVTSSSSSSSSSSTSSSRTSEKDNTTPGLRYKGIYTMSSQGRSQTTGGYTGVAGPDFETEIEIYDDYIMVGSTKCTFDKVSGGERVYSDSGWGFNGTHTYSTYYVDSNYNIRKVDTFSSQFGTDWFEYEVSKGRCTMPKYQPQYSGQSSYSGGSSTNNRDNSTYNQKKSGKTNRKACRSCMYTNGKCSVCKGTGRQRTSAAGVSSTTQCRNCAGSGRCPTCGGDGWID